VFDKSGRGHRLRSLKTAVLGGALTLLLTGCASDAPLDTLKPEGKWARKIDDLFQWPLWIAIAIFFIVEGLIIYAAIRFRHREGDDRTPNQIHGNTRLEVGLTVLPAAILLGLAVPMLATIQDLGERPKGDHLVIDVIGHQWWWEYRYEEFDIATATELVIPTNQDVELRLTSVDVIHAYWIPKLNGKRDVIPGRTQFLKLYADKPGVYEGTCTEYCGESHANMRNRAIAMPPDEFAQWVSEQQADAATPTGGPAAQGLELFNTKGCAGCHTIKGVSTGRVGPDLSHLQSRETFAGAIFTLNPTELAAWLRDPPGEKPGSRMPNLNLTEDEITALVAYLETLK
jgi:cytochrome c oxidase subunit II